MKKPVSNIPTILFLIIFSIGTAICVNAQDCKSKNSAADKVDKVDKDNKAKIIASLAKPVSLNDKPVKFSLTLAASANTPQDTLLSRIDKAAANNRIYIVLKDLCAAAPPGVLYHVYLDLPDNTRPADHGDNYVGSLNFFDAEVLPNGRFFSFDVTDIIRNLRAKKKLSENAAFTILPAGVPEAGAKPVIGVINLIEQ